MAKKLANAIVLHFDEYLLSVGVDFLRFLSIFGESSINVSLPRAVFFFTSVNKKVERAILE